MDNFLHLVMAMGGGEKNFYSILVNFINLVIAVLQRWRWEKALQLKGHLGEIFELQFSL